MSTQSLLSIGEKIKALRKKLDITQTQLAYKACHRSFISKLERDKETLTPSAAIKLSNNFNHFFKCKNMPDRISAADLLRDERLFFIENTLKQMKKTKNIKKFKLLLTQVETVALSCNAQCKALSDIYYLAYKRFMKINDLHNAELYLVKYLQMQIAVKDNKTKDTLFKLLKLLKELKEYRKMLFVIAFVNVSKCTNQEARMLEFYLAEACENSYKETVNISLYTIADLEKQNLTVLEYAKLNLIKGDCLDVRGEYKSAKDVYENILSNLYSLPDNLHIEYAIKSYLRISKLYFENSSFEDALSYLSKAFEVYTKNELRCSPDSQVGIFFAALNVYTALNDLSKSLIYFFKILSFYESHVIDESIIINSFSTFEKYCISHKLADTIIKVVDAAEAQVKSKHIHDGKILIGLINLMSFFEDIKDKDKYSYVFKKIKSISKIL